MTRASKTQASEPRAWQNRAACRDADPELFYPDLGGSYIAAKQICGGCPVRAECLAVAIRCKDLNGVWGGLTPDERRALEDTTQPGADPGALPGVWQQELCRKGLHPRNSKTVYRNPSSGWEQCKPCKAAGRRRRMGRMA